MPLLLVLLFILPVQVFAYLERIQSDKPLYDFGIVAGAGYVPHYPAANQGKNRYIAAPIFRYRGLRFRSDEEDSMKARIFANSLYGFDLSAGGSFSAKSDENDARRGMKDLDWTAELGPRFYLYLVKTQRLWWRLFLPVRTAFSTDLMHATYQGLVFAPGLNLRYFFDANQFNSITFSAVRTHTTHQLQEYFYEVKEKYQSLTRKAYRAQSGYLSSSLSLAFIHEKENIGFYGGLGMNSFRGAANSGSPLHKSDYTYAAFLGFSYIFYQSIERGFL